MGRTPGRPDELVADDLDWEQPTVTRRNGVIDAQCATLATIRAALFSRRGQWALLDTFSGTTTAGFRSARLRALQAQGDSRVAGLEFTARRPPDGGSKLYVRAAPP